MPWDSWPDWAHPDFVHQTLLRWFGPEWTLWIEVAFVGLAVLGAFVHFVLVPLGIRKK